MMNDFNVLEHLKGWTFQDKPHKFPGELEQFSTGLTHVENLLWYDGPIMDLYEERRFGRLTKHFLALWMDLDEGDFEQKISGVYHWIIFEVSNENLQAYRASKITTRDVERRAPVMFTYKEQDFECDKPALGVRVTFEQFEAAGLAATEGSFLHFEEPTTESESLPPATPGEADK